MAAAAGVKRRKGSRAVSLFFSSSSASASLFPLRFTFLLDRKNKEKAKQESSNVFLLSSSCPFFFAPDFHPRVPLRSLYSQLSICIDQRAQIDGTFLLKVKE